MILVDPSSHSDYWMCPLCTLRFAASYNRRAELRGSFPTGFHNRSSPAIPPDLPVRNALDARPPSSSTPSSSPHGTPKNRQDDKVDAVVRYPVAPKAAPPIHPRPVVYRDRRKQIRKKKKGIQALSDKVLETSDVEI